MTILKKSAVTFFFLFFLSSLSYSQDIQLGTQLGNLRQQQGGLHDYSDPTKINIKVAVWGFVRFPGRYIVPIETNVNDLLSYAGGPTTEAHLDDLRLARLLPDSSNQIIKLNYQDFLFYSEYTTGNQLVQLQPGDILLVSGEPRFYFRDYLSVGLSIFSALISLAILIINIAN